MVVVVFDQRDPKKLRTNLAPLTKFGPIHDYQLRLILRQHVRVGFRCAQPHLGAAKTFDKIKPDILLFFYLFGKDYFVFYFD
jgi:hypothetical protein